MNNKDIIGYCLIVMLIVFLFGSGISWYCNMPQTNTTQTISKPIDPWLCGDDNPSIRYKKSYSNKQLVAYDGPIKGDYFTGKVVNCSTNTYSYIEVVVVCYDSNGVNLGTDTWNTQYLGPHETWNYSGVLGITYRDQTVRTRTVNIRTDKD